MLADEAAVAAGSVVYYFELASPDAGPDAYDGPTYGARPPVKIGHSMDVEARARSIEAAWGPICLVATEPGGYAMEQLRHWQFTAARMPFMPLPGGSEFFECTDPIVSHMELLLRSRELVGTGAPR